MYKEMRLYAYGLTLRGVGPGCQPHDYCDVVEFTHRVEYPSGDRFYAILWYKRELTPEELDEYEMVRVECEDQTLD